MNAAMLRSAAAATAAAVLLALPAAASAMHAAGPDPWSAGGSSNGISWSVGASVGAAGGKAYERVYDGDAKLSQLDWDLTGVALVGAQGSVGFGGRFQVNAGLWAAATEGDGTMIDRDWFYEGRDWTHESRHPDTALERGTVVDVNLAVKALEVGPFAVSGIVGYTADAWKWSARGGTYVYSDTDNGGFRDLRGSFPPGPVIDYEQKFSAPYLGAGVDGALGPVALHGHLLLSSWVSAEDEDDHVLRDTLFLGDFSGGGFAAVGLSATWFITPELFAGAAFEARQFSEVRGDVTVRAPEGTFFAADGASVELGVASLLLSAGYRF